MCTWRQVHRHRCLLRSDRRWYMSILSAELVEESQLVTIKAIGAMRARPHDRFSTFVQRMLDR